MSTRNRFQPATPCLALLFSVLRAAGAQSAVPTDAITYYQGCETLQPTCPGEKVHPDPELQPGKVGKAFRIERRTVNLVTDPDLTGKDPEAWLRIGQPEFRAAGGFADPACCAVTRKDYLRQVVTGLAEGRLYCLSAHARSDAGSSLALSVKCGGAATEAPAAKLGAEFARVSLAFTAEAPIATVTLRSADDAALAVDAVQLEEGKSWPSSFWAKTGVLRGAEWVDVPPSAIRASKGAVSFWAKPQWLGEVGSGGMAFLSAYLDPNLGWAAQKSMMTLSSYSNPGKKGWENGLTFTLRDQAGAAHAFTVEFDAGFAPKPGEWMHLVLNWEVRPGAESMSSCTINGRKAAEKRFVCPGLDAFTVAYLGYSGGAYADGLIDEFALYNRPLTEGEVAAVFAACKPLR